MRMIQEGAAYKVVNKQGEVRAEIGKKKGLLIRNGWWRQITGNLVNFQFASEQHALKWLRQVYKNLQESEGVIPVAYQAQDATELSSQRKMLDELESNITMHSLSVFYDDSLYNQLCDQRDALIRTLLN